VLAPPDKSLLRSGALRILVQATLSIAQADEYK
jgi:hypothetical protein